MQVIRTGNAVVAGEQSKTRMALMTRKHVDWKGIPEKFVADRAV